ncbi:hypothetical protein Scep_027008 [Stephania cephalantha]|uniref:Uncharacterized protein n=1 Tax=Stephania cephalantha TaxID=152367 RepID=A0AAP0ELN4_9MAGN
MDETTWTGGAIQMGPLPLPHLSIDNELVLGPYVDKLSCQDRRSISGSVSPNVDIPRLMTYNDEKCQDIFRTSLRDREEEKETEERESGERRRGGTATAAPSAATARRKAAAAHQLRLDRRGRGGGPRGGRGSSAGGIQQRDAGEGCAAAMARERGDAVVVDAAGGGAAAAPPAGQRRRQRGGAVSTGRTRDFDEIMTTRWRAGRQGPRPKSDVFHGRPSILSGSMDGS